MQTRTQTTLFVASLVSVVYLFSYFEVGGFASIDGDRCYRVGPL